MDWVPPIIIEILASAKELKAGVHESEKEMDKLMAKGDTVSARMSHLGKMVGDWALMGAAGVAVGATALAFKYGEALDKLQLQGHLTEEQMKTLRGQILQVSTATATGSSEIADAYLKATKSGMDLAQSQQAVTIAAKFAKAENASLATTMDAAINIQQNHIAGTKSVAETMDIFTNAIKNSRLTADALTNALSGKALSAFAAYHIDLKTATTLLAGFANQGLNGTKAQIALKSGFAGLDRPIFSTNGHLSTTAKLLQSVGVNQQTLSEEARRPGGMLTVLSQLNQAWTTNATATQKAQGLTSFMTQVFGASAGPAFTNLISQLPQLNQLMEKMNTPGATQSAFQTWLSTPGGVIENFKTTMENALVPLGEYLLPKGAALAKWAASVASALSKNKDGAGSIASTIAGGILAGLAGAKLASIGVKIAELFGVTASGALAGQIGLVIGAGIMAFLATINVLDWLKGKATVHQTAFDAPWLQQLLAKAGISNSSAADMSLSAKTIGYLENKYGIYAPGTSAATKVSLKARFG